MRSTDGQGVEQTGGKKASIRQVAAIMFSALFMIGSKDTWAKGDATITLAQAVIGALVTGLIVILILASVVYFALH